MSTTERADWQLRCVVCNETYGSSSVRYRCDCGGTLDVVLDLDRASDIDLSLFDARRNSHHPHDRSGVWRFRELVLPGAEPFIVTRGEGNTNLYESPAIASYAGVGRLSLKHEGENPTGSFKDRGMTTGVTVARALGMDRVACASTGNTSASMASFAAIAGMRGYVFIPSGKIAYGKLSQALAYGARTLQIDGDFDAAMELVQQVCDREGIYLLNSVNPFRIEGQKAIGFELLQDLSWEVPDWLVLPGGNLGNSSAIGKGLNELFDLGLITRLPRIAVIQAAGASPFAAAFAEKRDVTPVAAETIATAIRIGSPISWRKSLRGVEATRGLVESVTDEEIMDAKAVVDAAGVGAEPASCATVAGVRKLVAAGTIGPDEHVAGILTGHLLKDPGVVVDYHTGRLAGMATPRANRPVVVDGSDLDAVIAALD